MTMAALFQQGLAAYTAGKPDQAAALWRKSAAVDPADVNVWQLLGQIHGARSEHVAAARSFGRALRLLPRGVAPAAAEPLINNFAAAQINASVMPSVASDAVLSNGVAAAVAQAPVVGASQTALDSLARAARQALAVAPAHATALTNFAAATFIAGADYGMTGGMRRGLALYERAQRLSPGQAAAHVAVASALARLGQWGEAGRAYARALALDPAGSHMTYHAANCHALGDMKTMRRLCRWALSLWPATAASLLCVAETRLLALPAALRAGRAAVALAPHIDGYYNNLASLSLQTGAYGEAQAVFRRALQLTQANALVHSNFLMAVESDCRLSPLEVAGEYRRFDAAHGRPRAAHHRRHDNIPDPNRPLRVGFSSSDFRQHVCSCFFLPLLESLSRDEVITYCYSDTKAPDAVTERIIAKTDVWRDVTAFTEAELDAQIRADQIDVLVDLAGHSAGNRLMVFARRPAPVQATWLGYPNTSGLSAVDYRIVDAVTDPPGAADGLASETLVRLPSGFLCYRPPDDTPEVSPAPCLQGGGLVFGSFNKFSKLSVKTLDAWSAVLRAAPTARLALKALYSDFPSVRESLLRAFADRGVADRVDFLPWTQTWRDHLALYDKIDVALDSFPYQGTTTSCEALWMGVPLVTIMGDRHAARVGPSILKQIGLDELVGATADEYVAIAADLARDPQRVAALRAGMRQRMLASSLCDETGFARRMQAALREMWRRWCAQAVRR